MLSKQECIQVLLIQFVRHYPSGANAPADPIQQPMVLCHGTSDVVVKCPTLLVLGQNLAEYAV